MTSAQAVELPGLHLDSTTIEPLPHIKRALTKTRRRTLTLVDSHAAAADAAKTYRELDARVYPKRTPKDDKHPDGNCRNYGEVEDAEKVGLAPGMAVCPACDFREDCHFHKLRELADDAQHAIAVLALASADFLGFTEDRHAVFVVSDLALKFFRPEARVPGDQRRQTQTRLSQARALDELTMLRKAFFSDGEQAEFRTNRIDKQSFWDVSYGFAQRLHDKISEPTGRPDEGFIIDPSSANPPNAWGASLWAALKSETARPSGSLVRFVTAATCGRLDSVYGRIRDDQVELTAVAKTPLPDKPIIVFAAESRDELARATDRTVFDLRGVQPPLFPVWQAAKHMTAKSLPTTAADLIRAYARNYGAKKIGVLVHRRMAIGLLRELKSGGIDDAAKLTLAFWHGDARPLRDCDLILAVGAPTISPEAVRRRLLQTGNHSAAAEPGDWGKLPWQATTAAGETILLPRTGYRNKAWQDVHQQELEKTIRRTLAIIGKPAILITDQELPYPVVRPPRRLSWRDARILNAIGEVGAFQGDTKGQIDPIFTRKEANTLLLAEMGSISPKCHPLTAAAIASRTGLKAKTVTRRLSVLRAAGYVRWAGKRGGWMLPLPSFHPVDAPGMPPVAGLPRVECSSPPHSFKAPFQNAAGALVDALASLAEEGGGHWAGTATELEAFLVGYTQDKRNKLLRAWLGNADRVGHAISRLAKELEAAGVRVKKGRIRGFRVIVLEQIRK